MLLYESGKLHIAENRKKIMLIPLIVILIAAICLVVYSFTADSAVNVGTDFTGGYKMRVKVGSRLTDETYDEYSSKIISIAENLTDEEGNKYGIKVTDCERYGTNNDSIAISYLGVASDDEMLDVVNPALKQALIDEILYVSPELTYSDGSIVAKYDGTILNGNIGDIKCDQLRKLGVAVTGYEYDADTLTVSVSSPVADSLKDEVSKALVLRDEYVGSVDSSGFVSSAVSSELLQRAVLAVVLAIACMLIYIWIRFELLSGLAAIVALFHDLIIMTCAMFIFHIELNQTFIIALVTILGYSINNTIIIFDRVRENIKNMSGNISNAVIINTSVKSTLSRTVFSTFTTLIMVLFVAIIGVADIRVFALPIIFGLIAGFYSANFIAPSVWTWLSDNFVVKGRKIKKA